MSFVAAAAQKSQHNHKRSVSQTSRYNELFRERTPNINDADIKQRIRDHPQKWKNNIQDDVDDKRKGRKKLIDTLIKKCEDMKVNGQLILSEFEYN